MKRTVKAITIAINSEDNATVDNSLIDSIFRLFVRHKPNSILGGILLIAIIVSALFLYYYEQKLIHQLFDNSSDNDFKFVELTPSQLIPRNFTGSESYVDTFNNRQ